MNSENKPAIHIWAFCIASALIAFNAIATPATNSPPQTTTLDERIEQFTTWLDTNTDGSLTGLGNAEIEKIVQWIDIQSDTKDQILNLEQQIKADEQLLIEKKNMLNDVQQKIYTLKLTPSQFEAIANYNKSLSHDLSFTEWVTEHKMWFDSIKDILIAALFFTLGMYWDSVQEKRRKLKKRAAKR